MTAEQPVERLGAAVVGPFEFALKKRGFRRAWPSLVILRRAQPSEGPYDPLAAAMESLGTVVLRTPEAVSSAPLEVSADVRSLTPTASPFRMTRLVERIFEKGFSTLATSQQEKRDSRDGRRPTFGAPFASFARQLPVRHLTARPRRA